MMIPLSHFLLLILASPGLITLGRASPVPTSSASSTSSTSSTTSTSSLVNPTPSTTIPTSSFGSPGAYALNTTATTTTFDYDPSETPAPPLSPSPPRRSMINLPRWLSVPSRPSRPSIPSRPSRPDVLRSTMGKLTNEKKYVLLGFSYTGQLAGTQHDKSLFPLAQLHIPGLPPSQPPQPGEEEGDLMLLQEPSIQDPKGVYWKCFIVASLQPWTLALPQLKSSLTYSTPQFPATIHGVNLPLEVMRIPKSIWEARGKELGIQGMCVNPRGKEVATLMIHKDMFAGNKMLSKGAQWEK